MDNVVRTCSQEDPASLGAGSTSNDNAEDEVVIVEEDATKTARD